MPYTWATHATPSQLAQVNYVMLIDPGNADNLSGCDSQLLQVGGVMRFKTSGRILADWLDGNPDAQLVVVAGDLTADAAHPVNGHAHAGIQNVYFNDIRRFAPHARSRVLVCDYQLNHRQMYDGSSPLIESPPVSCPSLNGVPATGSWNP